MGMGMGMGMGAMGKGELCPCPHHKMAPVGISLAILLFGGAFLLRNLGVISEAAAGILWPLAIVVAGLAKLSNFVCPCDRMPRKE